MTRVHVAEIVTPGDRSARKRLRRLVSAILIVPPLLAIVLSRIGGWRYAAGVETAALLFVGTSCVVAVALLASGRWPNGQRTMSVAFWNIDVTKHRRLFALLFLAFGAYASWGAATDIGDWIVPPDTRDVVVRSSRVSLRTGVTSVFTSSGTYSGPCSCDSMSHQALRGSPSVTSAGTFWPSTSISDLPQVRCHSAQARA